MSLYIPIILGTARANRRTGQAARLVLAEAQKRNEIEAELIDVKDFHLPATDNSEESEEALSWKEKMDRADGLVIVAPEYNHGYPGELKMMLDMLYESYEHKPVGIVGVGGGSGGMRMVEQLRLVAIELKMVPIREAVYFFRIKQAFNDSGSVNDSTVYERLEKFFSELIWYAKALKAAR